MVSKFYQNHIKHRQKKLAIIASVIVLLLFFLYIVLVRPVYALYQEVVELKSRATVVEVALRGKDLGQLESEVDEIQTRVDRIDKQLNKLRYLDWVPFIRLYYQDANNLVHVSTEMLASAEKMISDISPYSEVLGLTVTEGSQSSDSDLRTFIKLAPQLMPSIDSFIVDLEKVLPYLSSIHPDIYPNTEKLPVSDILTQVKETSIRLEDNIGEVKELVHLLPSLMGDAEPQKYLVLFQNDKELRPTGGFITSFAIVTVDAAEINISDARNIYEVSSEEAYLSPPSPIVTYLKQSLWRMRDTNFSPDFDSSMETFMYYWNNLGLTEVDGVVALDTQFMAGLLKAIGPVEIENYSYDFSAFPNLPEDCLAGGVLFTHENVVCRLEVYAQKLNLDQYQRKAVIGDLMERMFDRIMTLPAEGWQPLLEQVFREFEEKHVLVNLNNDEAQQLAENYNWAGRIKSYEGDYLHVNDSNLAGLKSDMYLKRTVEQKYEITDDGKITKRVKLIYENTGTFDGWLNAVARNYVRVYVPSGSRLVDVIGGEVATTTFEDLGKTVFDNFMLIPPLESREIEFVYELPFSYSGDLSVLIQKQPGKEVVYHKIIIRDFEDEFEVRTDATKSLSN